MPNIRLAMKDLEKTGISRRSATPLLLEWSNPITIRGMRVPRFKLRTMFVAITLLSVPIGWIGSQLNWIRQRHDFLSHLSAQTMGPGAKKFSGKELPWSLRLFGESPHWILFVEDTDAGKEANRLFPEAAVLDKQSLTPP